MLKNRSKAIFWVFLVFLVGVVFGGTVTFWGIQPRFSAVGDSTRPRQEEGKEQRSKRFMDHLSEQLNLDASQRSQLRQILEESRQQYAEVNKGSKQRFREIRRKTRDKIRTILKPEQTARFEQFLKELDEKRKQRQHSGGRGC